MNLQSIKKYFEPKNILDIGANCGQFYQLCKAYFRDCKIHSVEANPLCESRLKEFNPNYTICLLDSTPRYRGLFLNKDQLLSTGTSIYKELTPYFDNAYCVKIKSNTLDRLFRYQIFDLIKLDTQGSELDILKGGTRIIQRAKGLLVEVSHKPYNQNAPLSYEVVNYLLRCNFLLKETISTDSRTHQSDYFFVNEWWYDYYEKFIQE